MTYLIYTGMPRPDPTDDREPTPREHTGAKTEDTP